MLSAALIFVLVSVTSFFLVFGTRLNNSYLRHEQVVEERLGALERLSVSVYRYFKRVGDSLLLGSGSPRSGLTVEFGEIRRDLERLENAYASTSRLVYPASVQASQRNLRIGQLLDQTRQAFTHLTELDTGQNAGSGSHRLRELMDEKIDREFRALVGDGIEEERAQLDRLRADYRSNALSLLQVSSVLGVAVAAITLLVLYLLYQSIKQPLHRLAASTRSIAEGNYDDRVTIDAPREYADLAACFNDMAEQLKLQKAGLLRAQESLEEEVRRQTLELQRKNVQLEQLDDSRKRLLLDVGHELRTPLTVIQGELDIALRQTDAGRESLVAALNRIADVSSGLNRLVNDLFLIVRADFDPESISLAEVDYRALLGELYDQVAILAARKSISVDFDLPAQPLFGMADRDRIKQALTAILDNAVRYSNARGRIALRHRVVGNRLILNIVDEGIGIGADELLRVFERFYRTDAARKHSAQGSGLGLSVAAKIIEQHGGAIDLAPNPDHRGTRVEVTVPLKVDQ